MRCTQGIQRVGLIRMAMVAAAAGFMAIPNSARAGALHDAYVARRDLNASIRATAPASRKAKARLSASELATVRRMAANFSRTGDGRALLADWRRLIAAMSPRGIDINAFVQEVLRDSYLESSAELAGYAAKVKFFNHSKAQIRAEEQMEKATDTPVTAVRIHNTSARLAGARLRSGVQRARKLLQNSRRIQTDLYNAAMSIVRASHRGMTRGGVRPPHTR